MGKKIVQKVIVICIILMFFGSIVTTEISVPVGKNDTIKESSLREGSLFWGPIEVVSTESTDHSPRPYACVDIFGTVHVVWEDETNYSECGNDPDIFYKYKPRGGDWTVTEVVSTESNGESKCPTIAVDTNGMVHVAWYDKTNYSGCGENPDIFYKNKPNGGDWSVTEVVSTERNNTEISHVSPPTIVVDSFETVHIAWWDAIIRDRDNQYNIFYRMKPSEGSWMDTELISNGTYLCRHPSLGVDLQGNVHITWNDVSIFYKYKPYGGVWNESELVSTETDPASNHHASIAVESNGAVHIAWYSFSDYGGAGGRDDIFYKYKPSEGSWALTEVVSMESDDESRFPSIGIDNHENVHIAWYDFTDYNGAGGDGDVFYKYKSNGGEWSITEVVSVGLSAPSLIGSLAADIYDSVHVVWRDNSNYGGAGGDQDVFYRAIINTSNEPPSAPTIIGETNGKYGESYDYTFVSTDPEGQDVWYYINWGDDTYEEWIGPFTSNEEIMVSHIWEEQGEYTIQAKTKDIYDAESDWGYLEVTMPVNQQLTYPLFKRFLERFPNAFPVLQYIFSL